VNLDSNLVMLSPGTMARSSLEEMLVSLRRKDECEKPKDLPPALPARPTSRARLPSARRSLPNSFKVGGDNDGARPPSEFKGKDEGKRKDQNVESPYAVDSEESKNERTEGSGSDHGSAAPCATSPKMRELDWDDNIGYFIKKVTENENNENNMFASD